MKVINIVPVDNMRIIQRHSSIYMFLTHLVEKYPEYVTYAKRYVGYKILDNSLIELGKAADIERVVSAADTIGANEIILPDVFRNYYLTVAAVENALDKLEDLGCRKKYKLMAVCQGSNIVEFAECFHRLSAMDIDVIGIPKVCAKMHPAGRPFFEYLWRYGTNGKQIHLLGLWYSWEELDRYMHPDLIRSCDSCLLAFQALHNLPFYAVRPDGITIDLETAKISDKTLVERYDKQKWRR